MIKAQELRIGNYVLDTYNKVELVRNINERGINYYRDMGFDEIDLFEKINPIPLTEEWLLQFGFEDNTYGRFHIKLNDFCYFFVGFKDGSYSQLREFIDVADYDIEAPCKYVHQLQNLIFALTGSELY